MKSPPRLHYILLYKPYGVLSQFSRETGADPGLRTLKEFGPFPRNIYPAGRLDADSEGLLFLTSDNAVKHRLMDPKFGHPRTYLVQVEREPSEEALALIRNGGITLQGKPSLPAEVRLLPEPPDLPPRPVPIRFRKNVSTAWLEVILTEGMNRQVRKLTAAVGHPTLRLVRQAIGFLSLRGLQPGQWRELTRDELHLLKQSLTRRGKVPHFPGRGTGGAGGTAGRGGGTGARDSSR